MGPDDRLRNDHLNALALLGAWIVVLLIGFFAYLPGLNGPFVFDDFGSISALGDHGGVTDWDTFKAFVFGGHAGPTGRPLALLSFLIDGNNWPTDPWPFKRTNLIIHLISGVLLACLIGRILKFLDVEKQNARWIALICAAIWLLHPFLVSTTLYAVQRMAQLSTLFIFSGLIAYLYGRSLLATNVTKAYLTMSLSIVLFTFLAMISKENGVLLPLLIGVIELTVIASRQQQLTSLNRNWSIVFIISPSIAVALYLGEKTFSDSFFDVAPLRDFSIYERILTQPRVLVDYLQHWFVPKLYTTGVFQDHFIKSTGLLSPLSTLLSILFHIAIVSVALARRRKWPLFALATLFFYASHVLESSVLNLELYFEHRNYLASAFLIVPIIAWLHRTIDRQLFATLSASAILMLAGFTWYSANIWADFPSIVAASAQKAPTSARAQAQHATNLFNEQRYEDSIRVMDTAIQNIPNNSLLLLTRGTILCRIGALSASDFEQFANIVSAGSYDSRSLQLYTAFNTSVTDGQCPDVSAGSLRRMFENMLLVSKNADPGSLGYSQIKYFIGFIDARSGEPARAVAAFEESLQARPGAGHAMMMAALMASNKYYNEALQLSGLALAQLKANPPGVLHSGEVSESDIREFRAIVRDDMGAQEETDIR